MNVTAEGGNGSETYMIMRKVMLALVLAIVLVGCVTVPVEEKKKVGIIDFSFELRTDRVSFGLINGGNVKAYQTFVAGPLPDLYQVDVMIRRYAPSSPASSDVLVELYEVENCIPVGDPVAFATVEPPANHVAQLVSVPLSYQGLEEGKVYAISLTSEIPVQAGDDGSYFWMIGGKENYTPGTSYGRFDGEEWILQADPLAWPPGNRWVKIHVSN